MQIRLAIIFIQKKLTKLICHSIVMSIESRYDVILKDMITLLQQALFRFFTDSNSPLISEEVDLAKFKHYFNQFYKNMTALEDSFHEKSTKFTKNLTKLSDLFQKNTTVPKFSLQPTPSKSIEPSEVLSKPKTAHHNVPLKIIGEEQQQVQQRQRRSGTAEGKRRPQNFIIDFSQGKYRPKTGISRENKRYRNVIGSMNNQTISHDIESTYKNFRTFHSKDLDENEIESKKERKSFYNDLEKEQVKGETIYQNMVKVPKKKSISTHRWSFKINKLF